MTFTRVVFELSSDTLSISVEGEMSCHEVANINRRFRRIDVCQSHLVLDLRGVTFIESVGWRCVEELANRVTPNPNFSILASPCVKRLVGVIEDIEGPSIASAKICDPAARESEPSRR